MIGDKNIVITGASRGIGAAVARQAAVNGARVGLNYFKSKKEAESLAGELERIGGRPPLLLAFDATDPIQIERAVRFFVDEFGNIDGWVNNAAIHISGLLPTVSLKEIRAQIDSALLGPIFCCRAILPHMLRRHQGSIVNIGSIVTRKTFRGQSVYAAAKGGLLAFTQALATEYGRKGIRVNCIQPGPVKSDMLAAALNLAGEDILKQIPMGRYGTPRDIARLAVFLLSEQSSYMTGAAINIDGGYHLT
ncbi:MAG: SDR family oxidoreductase [Deltaproteobacteria bacterium]|nr:SDR family oxidoreductase [Deltaproteobacteria bacterium]